MRTLGIDPGIATLGWGVVDSVGPKLTLVGCAALTTPARTPLADRLLTLYDGLTALLAEYKPDAAAVEEMFFGKNVTTAITVGQARGVIMLVLAQARVPIFEYTPAEVKQALAGYGNADKRQMQEMVRQTFNLKAIIKPDDAADAAAIAVCHSYTAPMLERIASATRAG